MSLEPPEFLDKPTFEKRRTSDAQGVIDDLLRLIALQAADLHEQRLTEVGKAVRDGEVSPAKTTGKSKKAKVPKQEATQEAVD